MNWSKRTPAEADWREILENHKKWLIGNGGSMANLHGAYLAGAYLRGADLTGANMTGAYLTGADLTGADLIRLIAETRICPETGAFYGWKKTKHGGVVDLLIPADAKRLGGLIGRKCRAEFADVVSIHGTGPYVSIHDDSFVYEVGKRVTPREPFSDDVREECASGIHFFMSRIEAEEYAI